MSWKFYLSSTLGREILIHLCECEAENGLETLPDIAAIWNKEVKEALVGFTY